MGTYSQNLNDLIRTSLPENFVEKSSALLGESADKTNRGINTAVPALLGGLDEIASTSDGARRLASTIEGTDEGLLANARFLGQGGTFSINQGLTMLRSLLGADRLSQIAGSVGRSSELSSSAATSLLGMLAPIVFSVLKREKVSRGLDSIGLSNLLASQRSHISSPMSGVEEPTERHRDVATATGPSTSPRRSWALPLALLAGLTLIWWLASRPKQPEYSRVPHETVHAAGEENAAGRPMAGGTATFEQLKAKYQPVLDKARAEGVQINSLHEQGGKLVIKGSAPSLDAVKSLRDEIQRINPQQDDIIADFPVKQP